MTSSETVNLSPASKAATERQPVRWPVAAVGGIIAALGVSGLVDDSGLIEHPWWMALVAAAVVAALVMIGRTLQSLISVSTSDT